MKNPIKYLLLGFVGMGFVGCDSISGGVCGKFTPPRELTDEEKGLISACEYTREVHF